jgi:hypothetical protein
MTNVISRRTVTALAFVAVLLAGATASCEQSPGGRSGGIYQGGNDAAPRFR